MKKLITLILTVALLIPAFSVYAEYDYTAMVSELGSLIEQCESMGISTDYETVNYKVIERFEKYMNADAQNGVDSNILDYNDAQITRLYNETKEKLNAYINGTEYPKNVIRRNMNIFSVGYGHFDLAQKDIPEFQDFGASNIQIEIGPTSVRNEEPNWKEDSNGELDITVKSSTAFKRNGESSLYVNNLTEETVNVYYLFSQIVDCKPNTTYQFGCYSRITQMDNFTNYVSLNGVESKGRKLFAQSTAWTNTGGTYTTEADKEQLQFTIAVSGVLKGYFDDCYLYELDSEGNVVSDNLLKNPGFDEGRSYLNSMGYIIDALNKAERNNILVNLLLSPHYFPTNIEGDIYNPDASGFLKYNINAPEAKEVLENYLRTILPNMVGYKALSSIVIANEPVFKTTDYPEFYNPLFQDYLKDVHGDIDALNEAYGKSYSGFSDIRMPEDVTAYDALAYDWIEFNDKTLADWHGWMAGIVDEYLPDVPVNTKMMGIIEGSTKELDDRLYLTRGTDIDLLGEVSDWAGNDSYDIIESPDTYYRTMFLYDYQSSAVGKPVYNSEDHLINDRNEEYSEKQRMHLGNSLWQGAVHGRSMSTLWVWERSRDSSSSIYNGALTRPDIIAETGKRSLDLARLSDKLAYLSQSGSDVALWYSKPSRLYDSTYSKKMMNTYKALLSIGKKPGIVSDKSISTLNNYKLLVIPGAGCCTDEALEAVNGFIAKGGKVIYSDGSFAKDVYKNARGSSDAITGGYLYLSNGTVSDIAENLLDYMSDFGLARVMLKTLSGEIPANIDWTYTADSSGILINASNLTYNDAQSIEVYFDGKKVTGMKELITDSVMQDSVELIGYTPVLLEKKFISNPNTVNKISAYDSVIRWTYANDDRNTANVYKVLKNGMTELLETVSGQSYTYKESGTYLVKSVSSGQEENNGKMITVGESLPFTVEITDVKHTDKSVLCDIKLVNSLNYYATGVLMLKMLGDDGEVIDHASYKSVMKAGSENSIRISALADEIIYGIEVVALDSYNGNVMSDSVARVFIN